MQPERISYRASAPGSMMMLGEYAVLHGSPALVCAVDKRITVTLTPRQDKAIHLHSDLHGHLITDLSTLPVEKPFHFVSAAIKQFHKSTRAGFDLHIASDFSDRVGFGSSAAVTVATLAALAAWHEKELSSIELLRQARQVIRHVQGTGSGADVAASVYGGMVVYHAQPLYAEKCDVTHPITACYAGFKTPTATAIQQVQDRFAAYPDLFYQLCRGIKQCAVEGIRCVKKQDWSGLGVIFNAQQGLLEALGVSMPVIHDLLLALRADPAILGAKISGSGLGDCVMGLGDATKNVLEEMKSHYPEVAYLPVAMTMNGVSCEKI